MNNQRIDQIKESLHGLGTRPETSYTNQEIVDNLVLLQQAMTRGVFERTHAENLRDRDIMLHFEALAKEYGLDGTDTFHRFKTNMEELGYMIGTIKKGMKGEQLARNSLKLLICDKAVRILYNVQLEDADTQAEYDAIVLTPYGMFVVEVKNWNLGIQISPSGLMESCSSTGISYDLPGRMSTKEALLREHLQELDACISPKEDVNKAHSNETNSIPDLPKWEIFAVLGVAVGLAAAIVPSAINALTKIKR